MTRAKFTTEVSSRSIINPKIMAMQDAGKEDGAEGEERGRVGRCIDGRGEEGRGRVGRCMEGRGGEGRRGGEEERRGGGNDGEEEVGGGGDGEGG